MPLLDLAGGISLATSLKTAMPAKMPISVKSAAREMVAAADALADAWSHEPKSTVATDTPGRRRRGPRLMLHLRALAETGYLSRLRR